jgi:outer membrane protein assembly factor BamB
MSPEGDCVAVLQGQKLVLLDSRGVLQDEMDAPFCWLIGPPHISVSSHGDFIGVSAHGNLRLMNKGGKLLWEYEASHEVTDVSISRDGCSIAAGSEDGYLYFFDSDGNLLWKYQTEDDIHSVSISSDGNYIACGSLNSGEVYLLDRSGRLLWCNQLADTVRAVCVEGNYVVADSLEGTVCLLDIQGSLVWSKDIGGEWATAISVSPDGHVAAAGFTWGSPDYFYYWDREGNLLWKHESRGPSCEALAAEVSGGQYVLFGTWNDGIYCFNEAGEMLWNYATGGGRVLDILILNENNGNIVAAADVSLNLLDRQGELLGRRELIYGMSLVSVSSNSYLVAEYGNISLHELGLTP